MLPFWDALRHRPTAQAAMRGTDAAVVGILGAALYNPVWTSAVLRTHDFAVAPASFLLLTAWKLPPWNRCHSVGYDRRHFAVDLSTSSRVHKFGRTMYSNASRLPNEPLI